MSATTFALAQLSPCSAASSEIVFSLRMSADRKQMLAATSTGDLCHLDPNTLRLVRRFRAHQQRIVDVDFVQSSTNGVSVLCSVGMDGLVGWWDLRQAGKTPALHIQTGMPLTTGHVEPFGSNLLATGCERVNHQSPICFWDVRQTGTPVGKWTDLHTEDITMVRFHPEKPGCLVSASIDGLLCQSHFDAILAPSEEDSLQSVIQTASPIDSFSFVPTTQVSDLCAVLSPMQTVSLVRLSQGAVFGHLGDMRQRTRPDATVVSILPNPASDCPIMFVTDERGDVMVHLLTDETGEGVQQIGAFGGGHSESVRSLLYLAEYGTVFTGGEDAKVIGWSIHA